MCAIFDAAGRPVTKSCTSTSFLRKDRVCRKQIHTFKSWPNRRNRRHCALLIAPYFLIVLLASVDSSLRCEENARKLYSFILSVGVQACCHNFRFSSSSTLARVVQSARKEQSPIADMMRDQARGVPPKSSLLKIIVSRATKTTRWKSVKQSTTYWLDKHYEVRAKFWL